jgi:glutamyl-tRNA reductase
VAAADRFTVEQRQAFSAGIAGSGIAVDRRVVVLETCHRVEVHGVGEIAARWPEVAVLDEGPASEHLIRLAAGLESAVLGEDQILHQVRTALADLRNRRADPTLIRLFELAVGAGRRARTGSILPQSNLGELAVRWLEARGSVGPGRDALVVGTGRMARLAAAAFARRQARVAIASRTPQRATELANAVSGVARSADEAARNVAPETAVVVATRGGWAPTPVPGVTVVDLSVPPALPAAAIAALGDRFADVDRLWADAATLMGAADGPALMARYRERAEAVAEDAISAFRAWRAGRESVATLRALRDRTERQRAAEVERLLRRLPSLDDRERRLVEAFSERLVAGVLHRPSAALRDDLDGSAADAATRLFGL